MTSDRSRLALLAAILLAAFCLIAVRAVVPGTAHAAAEGNGIVMTPSAHDFEQTVARIKADIAGKGITFFLEVDQQKLAADAGIKLAGRSTLLIFGNPALGSHFITSKREAGIDWPVRLLVTEDEAGRVVVVSNDFDWIARRHGITDRAEQFAMATKVITSIIASVQ